jgi:hypothetical protein
MYSLHIIYTRLHGVLLGYNIKQFGVLLGYNIKHLIQEGLLSLTCRIPIPYVRVMPLCTSMHARPRTKLMRTGRARSLALVFASQHATMAMCTSSYQRGNSSRRLLSSELDRACLAELADISVLPVSSYMHGSSIWRSRRADRRCAYRMCVFAHVPESSNVRTF